MFWQVTDTLLQAFAKNSLLFLLTLIIALPLGLAISFGTRSPFKALRLPLKGLLWIIRGTPLMLQIIIVFYIPRILAGGNGFERFWAAVVAFGLNYAFYFSEIFRGGIESIPKGQLEAARVLGLNRAQTFGHIVLPQVIKRIVPPMSNEFMTLVKDTSLANVIAVTEIIYVANQFVAGKAILWPVFYAALFFLVFNGLLTLLFRFLEKKLSYYR